MHEMEDKYEEETPDYLRSNLQDVDGMDLAEDGGQEDHGNRSVLQLTNAVTSVMDDIEEDESNEELDLAGG